VDLFSAVVTLFLVMDPLGNIPVFLSVLKSVPPERRRLVLAREIALAYVVLLVFLLIGDYILRFLGVQQEAVSMLSAILLLSSIFLYRVLKERGLIAVERLMGMLLVMVAVQAVARRCRHFLRTVTLCKSLMLASPELLCICRSYSSRR
jgi:multiple antibiotic resistance protein